MPVKSLASSPRGDFLPAVYITDDWNPLAAGPRYVTSDLAKLLAQERGCVIARDYGYSCFAMVARGELVNQAPFAR